ncbi:hypothetical protein AAVH_30495, partial [Aphelenchoides avenae]
GYHGADDKIKIFVEEPAANVVPEPDYEASIDDGDHAETCHRLQHVCIKDFCVGIRALPLMRYWNSQESASFTVVSIDFCLDDDTDYDVLDSIVNHANGPVPDFPSPAFFFNEPGYPNYELCCSYNDAAGRIDGFIESFVRDSYANTKLKSVCMRWTEWEDMRAATPKQLREPSKIDMPLPKNDLPEYLSRYDVQVSQCEMHSFVNKKQWKRMDVYKWSLEYELFDGRFTEQILHCRVKNL